MMRRNLYTLLAIGFLCFGGAANLDAALTFVGSSLAQTSDVQAFAAGSTLLGDATQAKGNYSGNDNTVFAALNDDDLFGDLNWIPLGKSDDALFGPFTGNPNVTDGTLTLDNALDGHLVLSIKAASFFSLYYFNATFFDVTHFEFITDGTAVNNNGVPRSLSHATLFQALANDNSLFPTPTNDIPPDDVIPEPTSVIVWSLLGAAGLIGAWWRRRLRAG